MRYLIFTIFASAGVGLGVVNLWNNATAINGGQFILNDLTALVAGLGLTGALLSLGLAQIATRSRMVATLAVLVILGCTIVSVGYTLARVGGATDDGASEAKGHNQQIERIKADIAYKSSRLDGERKVAARECRGYKPGVSRAKKWPLCLTAQGLVKEYQKDLADAREALGGLGAAKVADPAGERLEAVFGHFGITAARYQTAHPVITAATLELGVNLLLTVAGLFLGGGTTPQRPRKVDAPMIDITPKELVNPVALALQYGPSTNRELAKRLGWSETRTSRAVKALVDEKQVEVTRVGRSNRIKLIN